MTVDPQRNPPALKSYPVLASKTIGRAFAEAPRQSHREDTYILLTKTHVGLNAIYPYSVDILRVPHRLPCGEACYPNKPVATFNRSWMMLLQRCAWVMFLS